MLSYRVNLGTVGSAGNISFDSSELGRSCGLGLAVGALLLLLPFSALLFNSWFDDSSGPASALTVLVFLNGFLQNACIHPNQC